MLKTSNRMSSPVNYSDNDESESVINRRNWRHELSKSYNDISKPIELSNRTVSMAYKDKTQSVYDLPKPSRLFGWSDEFHLHSYDGLRGHERSEGPRSPRTAAPHSSTTACDKVKRSKSFAVGTSSDKSSNSEDPLDGFRHQQRNKTKSYKQTKVSSPPKGVGGTIPDHFFPPNHEIPIAPPKEFAGLSTDIQHHYDAAKKQLRQKNKQNTKTNSRPRPTSDAVYEFERKIPLKSSLLECQKFKTVIFVSGN